MESISSVAVSEMIIVVLRVNMHCEACSQRIKKKILKMHGVQEVDPDLKTSEVTVKGVFEPERLVEYVNKKTRKQVVILQVNQDPLRSPPKEAEKNAEGETEINGEEVKEKVEGKKANSDDRATITKKWSSVRLRRLGLKTLLPWRRRGGEGDQEERAELLLPAADLY